MVIFDFHMPTVRVLGPIFEVVLEFKLSKCEPEKYFWTENKLHVQHIKQYQKQGCIQSVALRLFLKHCTCLQFFELPVTK